MQFIMRFIARVYAAYQVLRGHGIAIPIYDADTCLFVLETEGSQVTYFKAINLVHEDTSYCLDISKVVLWAATKPRFFWKADTTGAEVMAQANSEYSKHEKK